MENINKKILEEYKNGNIVLNTPFGLHFDTMENIINQTAEGLLWDLNRDEATIMTFIDDEKWINDYACSMVIKYLMDKLKQK